MKSASAMTLSQEYKRLNLILSALISQKFLLNSRALWKKAKCFSTKCRNLKTHLKIFSVIFLVITKMPFQKTHLLHWTEILLLMTVPTIAQTMSRFRLYANRKPAFHKQIREN